VSASAWQASQRKITVVPSTRIACGENADPHVGHESPGAIETRSKSATTVLEISLSGSLAVLCLGASDIFGILLHAKKKAGTAFVGRPNKLTNPAMPAEVRRRPPPRHEARPD
jgi:hypothetical protein